MERARSKKLRVYSQRSPNVAPGVANLVVRPVLREKQPLTAHAVFMHTDAGVVFLMETLAGDQLWCAPFAYPNIATACQAAVNVGVIAADDVSRVRYFPLSEDNPTVVAEWVVCEKHSLRSMLLVPTSATNS